MDDMKTVKSRSREQWEEAKQHQFDLKQEKRKRETQGALTLSAFLFC
jgi:hypothetical protein